MKPRFQDIPQLTQPGHYQVNISWDSLEDNLARYFEIGLDIDPDFQRGHVWSREQQIRYVEFILRGGGSSKVIYFNHPNWMGTYKGDFVLVDGKQRLEAVRAFLRNDIPACGFFREEYADRVPMSAEFLFNVNSLKHRCDVLNWYIDLNTGGVVHTPEEIENVKRLLLEDNP